MEIFKCGGALTGLISPIEHMIIINAINILLFPTYKLKHVLHNSLVYTFYAILQYLHFTI